MAVELIMQMPSDISICKAVFCCMHSCKASGSCGVKRNCSVPGQQRKLPSSKTKPSEERYLGSLNQKNITFVRDSAALQVVWVHWLLLGGREIGLTPDMYPTASLPGQTSKTTAGSLCSQAAPCPWHVREWWCSQMLLAPSLEKSNLHQMWDSHTPQEPFLPTFFPM